MEAVLERVTSPQFLPVVFGFVSCFVSGTLALGEGVIFMLLYEVSRSYGLFGVNTSRFEGVLFSLLISVFSQLPIIFAGRYEMSAVLGYGVCMALVSLCFITTGVGMLVSGHEEILGYAAAGFMVFSFFQLLKASLEFGEKRANDRSAMSPRYHQVLLDSTGTAVISAHHSAAEFSHHQEHVVSELVRGFRDQPSSLSALHDVSPLANVDVCHRVIVNIIFPDDCSSYTDRRFSKCIASMVSSEASSCKDMATLLREDSLALKLMGAYCRRQDSQSIIGRILDPVFEAIVHDLSAADAASPAQQMRELHSALNKIIPKLCSHMHDLPLGVQESAAALVQSLLNRQHHQNQPLTLASAVGSLVFLRCIVPYTVDYGIKHAQVQRFFIDISSVLQKISNGAEFPPAHRLFEMNAAIKILSPTLHSSFMSTFGTNLSLSEQAPPSCASSSDTRFNLGDSTNRAVSKDDIRCFVRLLTASAAAAAAGGHVLDTELHNTIMQLDSELCLEKQYEFETKGQTNTESAYLSGFPHWEQVDWFLRRNPSFAAAYEHFFPGISESGTSVETIIVVLLIGTALSAICSTAVGAGGPPRIMVYHFLNVTKGAMRGLSWVFYLGTLFSLLEIAQNPVANTLVTSQTWLYVCMAFFALIGSQIGTYFRQFVHRRVLMFWMYLLLWANCCLLVWPWDSLHAPLSLEPQLFVLGSAALAFLAPICFFYPAPIRSMYNTCIGPIKAGVSCCCAKPNTATSESKPQLEREKTRLLYGTE